MPTDEVHNLHYVPTVPISDVDDFTFEGHDYKWREKLCSTIGAIMSRALDDPPQTVKFRHPIAKATFVALNEFFPEVDKVLAGPDAVSAYMEGRDSTDVATEIAGIFLDSGCKTVTIHRPSPAHGVPLSRRVVYATYKKVNRGAR